MSRKGLYPRILLRVYVLVCKEFSLGGCRVDLEGRIKVKDKPSNVHLKDGLVIPLLPTYVAYALPLLNFQLIFKWDNKNALNLKRL